jgi:hypothetical protein
MLFNITVVLKPKKYRVETYTNVCVEAERPWGLTKQQDIETQNASFCEFRFQRLDNASADRHTGMTKTIAAIQLFFKNPTINVTNT